MNYGVNYILIKSNWFNPQEKKTKMSKITSNGLLVYLTLFKFKLFDFDKNNNTFVSSINLLSKEIPNELKLSKEDIYKIIRHLQRLKVIKVTNISNWNSQMVKDGKVDYDRVLMIEASDHPQTKNEQVNGKWLDKPISEDDYYIAVHAPSVHKYLHEYQFDANYVTIFTLMQKYNRTTTGFYMSIEKMEHVTGIDKNTINRITWKLYECELLVAYKRKNQKGDKYHEYHICNQVEEGFKKQFLESHGDEIQRWKKRIQKKRDRQSKKDNKKSEVVKAENTPISWGDDPFNNVGNESISFSSNEDEDLDEFIKIFG